MGRLIFLLILLFFISCAQSEIEPESQCDQNIRIPHVVQFDSVKSGMDSLLRVSKIQSDYDVLMMNSISFSNGEFRLCVTAEEALMMGIPYATYAKYVEITTEYNK